MANTPNFALYKPNRADTSVEVDTSLADNFTKIDTELQNNKGGLTAHINDANAHTSENITHSDGNVKTTLDNHEERIGQTTDNINTVVLPIIGDLGTRMSDAEGTINKHIGDISDLETRVDDIETLGLDKLAPNLEGRISTIESDVEGILAPATFDAMDQQSYIFDAYRIGYVNNKIAPITVQDLFGRLGEPTPILTLRSWHDGKAYGGGVLIWDDTRLRSEHNGGTIFSPTVPWTTNVVDYLNAVGETAPTSLGCWVRKDIGDEWLVDWFGGKFDDGFDNADSLDATLLAMRKASPIYTDTAATPSSRSYLAGKKLAASGFVYLSRPFKFQSTMSFTLSASLTANSNFVGNALIDTTGTIPNNPHSSSPLKTNVSFKCTGDLDGRYYASGILAASFQSFRFAGNIFRYLSYGIKTNSGGSVELFIEDGATISQKLWTGDNVFPAQVVDGIALDISSTDSQIGKCVIAYFKTTGVKINAGSQAFHDTHIYTTDKTCKAVEMTTSGWVTFVGCNFDLSNLLVTDHALFTGCTFYKYDGIPCITITGGYLVQVRNNYFKCMGVLTNEEAIVWSTVTARQNSDIDENIAHNCKTSSSKNMIVTVDAGQSTGPYTYDFSALRNTLASIQITPTASVYNNISDSSFAYKIQFEPIINNTAKTVTINQYNPDGTVPTKYVRYMRLVLN